MANRTSIHAAVLVVGIAFTAAWLAWRNVDADESPLVPTQHPATASPATAGSTSSAAAPTRSAGLLDSEAASPPRQAISTPAIARSSRMVHGRVLLDTGSPVTNVKVAIGTCRTKTTADGCFRLECTSDGAALVATCTGLEPTVIDAVATRPEVLENRELSVVLLGPASTITGWLVDGDGTACTGWHVELHGGGTECGHDGLPKLAAEDLAAGADELSIDGWTRNAPSRTNPNDRPVGTDGSFSIGGLRTGRDYVLRARNERTLQTVTSLPVRAGTQGFRFVVPEGRWRESVHGRVIDRNGGAIAGVRVRLTMRVHRNGNGETYQTGQEVRTHDSGRFEFCRVPHEDLLLRFDLGDVESLYHELRAEDPGQDLVIVLSSQCRFRCEPAANLPLPATLRVLDESDRPLRIEQQLSDGRSIGNQRLAVPDGGGEFAVSDRAAWLVFEVGEQEIRRLPLRLRRGEVPIVRG